ncbi:hypothetical protein [Listonella phage phiHSIC]|uniref:single strand DNA binding protein n=1 Tax=Listonella phage phiHSIC TaxID=310539 RepID=UPI00004C7426|nr:single strand DNA binding protein [Listonella phage phiHSIC]AAW67542.1 hypothetical protein [Listonella phage phiHSIC]
MSFFTLSDGQAVEQQTEFDAGGQDFEAIPNNTKVLFAADTAEWAEYEGDQYINIKWDILDGEYKGRKIFQKVRVKDSDPKKRDKALRMLVAIDTNCGGGLMRLGTEPTDMDLSVNILGKPMHGMLKVWQIKDENGKVEKEGNWVAAVSSATNNTMQAAPQKQEPEKFETPTNQQIGF